MASQPLKGVEFALGVVEVGEGGSRLGCDSVVRLDAGGDVLLDPNCFARPPLYC